MALPAPDQTSEQTSVSLCLESAPYWWHTTVSTGFQDRMLSSRVVVRLLAKQLVRSVGLDSHIWSACTHLKLHHGLLFSQTSEVRDATRERVCAFKCVCVYP